MSTLSFAAYPGGPYAAPPVRKRPIGLVVLGILFLIGSVFMILNGASALQVASYLAAAYNLGFGIVGILVAIFMLIGRYYGVVLAYIIVALVVGIIVGGITLANLVPLLELGFGGEFIAGFVASWIVAIIIYIIIIWYLRKPNVRAFFGKGPTAPAPPTIGIPPTPPPPQAQTPLCPTCGATLQYVAQYQRYWCPNEQRYV